MLLYLLRHGNAEPTKTSDAERNLTEKGRTVTSKMMKLLAESKLEKPELIVSSSLIRAEQTAEIATRELGGALRETSSALKPESSLEQAMAFIESKKADYHTVMLVSHNPLISSLANALVSGGNNFVIEMGNSALALFEIRRFDFPRMKAGLQLFITPEIL